MIRVESEQRSSSNRAFRTTFPAKSSPEHLNKLQGLCFVSWERTNTLCESTRPAAEC